MNTPERPTGEPASTALGAQLRRDNALADAASAFADLCRVGAEAVGVLLKQAKDEDRDALADALQRDVAAGITAFPPTKCPLCDDPGELSIHPRSRHRGWVCANGHRPLWILPPAGR